MAGSWPSSSPGAEILTRSWEIFPSAAFSSEGSAVFVQRPSFPTGIIKTWRYLYTYTSLPPSSSSSPNSP